MNWQVNTATARISGSSSMATGTALSRTVVAIPASKRITGFRWEWQLMPAVGAGTYASFAVGVLAASSTWLAGISYVVSPGAAPNLLTDTDNVQFLDVQGSTPGTDRNTINTAGTPGFQDEYRWNGIGQGRIHLPTGTGGSIFFHVANTAASTIVTGWVATVRAIYA